MLNYKDLLSQLEKPKSNIFIYGLVDPFTNKIRYIGQTFQGFKRIREHYNRCDRKSKSTNYYSPSNLWIQSLKKQNKIFNVVYLEYFDTNEMLNDREIYWISKYKNEGYDLLNLQSGGQNKSLSIDQRLMISKRTKEAMKNPEVIKKLSNSLKGKKTWMFGKKHKTSSLKKLSEAQEKNIIYIQDDLGNIYRGTIKCAEALGVQPPAVWKAIHGYCKTVKGRVLKRVEK